jgi:hypothetical protein
MGKPLAWVCASTQQRGVWAWAHEIIMRPCRLASSRAIIWCAVLAGGAVEPSSWLSLTIAAKVTEPEVLLSRLQK